MKKEEKKVKETKKETKKYKQKVEKKKQNKVVVDKKGTKKEKKKRENIFKAIGRYFRGVAKEIKRIKWTTGKELLKYSVAAVAFVIFFGIYFYGIDWIALLVRSLAK